MNLIAFLLRVVPVCLCLLLYSLNSMAQLDTVYLAPNKKLTGKVVEVSSERVKVEKPNGTIYNLDIEDVYTVVYAGGEEEVFFADRKDKYFADKRFTEGFGRHMVAFNFIAVLAREVELQYEHFLMEGKLSLKPFVVGYLGEKGRRTNFPNNIRDLAAGLDILYYPTGQGRVKYFVGPGLEMGTYEMTYSNRPAVNRSYYFVYLNNGILFQPTSFFNVGLCVGMGFRENTDRHPASSYANLRANFGLRF